MDRAEQRALGDAAADRLQVRHRLAEQAGGGVVPAAWAADRRGGARVAPRPRSNASLGAILELASISVTALCRRRAQPVEILQIEEGQEVFVQRGFR